MLHFFGNGVESAENGEAPKPDRAGEKHGDEARRGGRHHAPLHRSARGVHPAGGEAREDTEEGDCRSASPTGSRGDADEGVESGDEADRDGEGDPAVKAA